MPRSPVLTRTASVADVPVLVALWGELREIGGRAERAVNPIAVADIAARLGEAIADDRCRVVLACADDEPAGMVVLRALRPDPLSDNYVVQIAHFVVWHAKRRRGVGHALVAAAADFADELQIEHLATGLFPSLRDASRFYARLGFAPVLVQRVAPVGIVRRRLYAENTPRRVDDLVRRRRVRRPVPAQRTSASVPERGD